MSIKKLNEEVSNILENIDNMQDYLDDVNEVIEIAVDKLNHLKDRINYRFVINPSYFGDEAINKLHDLRVEIEETTEKLYDKVYGQIG